MECTDLLIIKRFSELKEWVSRDWTGNEPMCRAESMEFIEIFAEFEEFIAQSDQEKELREYLLKNYTLEQVKAVKRAYYETKRIVGLTSLDFEFFIDDTIDDMTYMEELEVSNEAEKEKSEPVKKKPFSWLFKRKK